MRKKDVFLEYGPRNLSWLMDHYNDIHIRFAAKLDHVIDGSLLEQAWKKTRRVYPVLDCVIEMEGKNLYLYKADGENKAIQSKAPITPGSDLVAGCVVTATYFGNSISLSAYHTMVDGDGLREIFKTLLYFYLSARTGVCDAPTCVQTEEGREISAYYKTLLQEDMSDFTPVPLHCMPYLRAFTEDTDMKADQDGSRLFASLRFPAAAFMEQCKAIGASPSAMLGLLMSKAFYTLNPQERDDLLIEVTTSVRNIFHAEGCISNCTSCIIADVTYEDTMEGAPEQFTRKFRQEVNLQRTADYVKTFRVFEQTHGHNYVHKPITLTYMGKIDLGENTKHISYFEMVTNATQLVMLVQLCEDFILMLELGKATQKYLDHIYSQLSEMGIHAFAESPLHSIITDSDTQVL